MPTKPLKLSAIPRRVVPAPPAPAVQETKYGSLRTVKATSITIDLEDGSKLVATGGHAADVFVFMFDCICYCSVNPGCVPTYLGPELTRVDKNGETIKSDLIDITQGQEIPTTRKVARLQSRASIKAPVEEAQETHAA